MHDGRVIETTSSWSGVVAFYLSCGFDVVGEHDGDTWFEWPMHRS